MSYTNNIKPQTAPVMLKEDDKIPLFLVKLWNIVEDPAYFDVVRWDDSGYSFHILEPYLFCRNVLPQYFKHNNLNSLIRQLNMYGFRKMTPIERTSLARAESDQDHLEFSHPYFVREHPELLVNIKRKAPAAKQHTTDGTVNVPAKDLTAVFEELRALRDKQKQMETRVSGLTKENEIVWQEMSNLRGAHMKQQQIVTKLVQFMVAMLEPNRRIGNKRPLLAIDDMSPTKRQRIADIPIQSIGQNNVVDILDRLLREHSVNQGYRNSNQPGPSMRMNEGPIIAEVTDELDNLAQQAAEAALPRMNTQVPPVPPVYSQPQYPAQNMYYPEQQQQQVPLQQPQQQVPPTLQPQQQPLQQSPLQQQPPLQQSPLQQVPLMPQPSSGRRNSMPSNMTNPMRPQVSQINPNLIPNLNLIPPSSVPLGNINMAPPQMPYIPNPNVQVPSNNGSTHSAPLSAEPLVKEPPSASSIDPLINTPPATAAQVSLAQSLNLSPTEFSEYLNGMNASIDNCRSLIGGHWDDLDLDGLLDYDEKSDSALSPSSDPNEEKNNQPNIQNYDETSQFY